MKILDRIKMATRALISGDVAESDAMMARLKPNVNTSQMFGRQRPVFEHYEYADRALIAQDRWAVGREVREMVATDGRVDRLLYKLASDAALNSFTVTVENAETDMIKEQSQNIINRTRLLIDDKRLLRGWSKALLRDGDLFLQLIVDGGTKEIVKVRKLAAEITHSRMSPTGEFPEDKKPYYQADFLNWIDDEAADKEFELWEIVHVKWDEEDGKPYGKPLFASSRLAWRRLVDGERDISIRRRTRSGLQRKHKVGTTENPGKWEEIEEYKRRNQDAIDHPMRSHHDWYTNGRTDIETLEGDPNIEAIGDIQHHEGLLWIASGVPQALTSGGRESATNMNVIKEQEEDYLRVVGDVNRAMEAAFRQIFDFALLLKEIDPDSIKYSFNWGAKDRDDVDKKIARAKELQGLGFSFRTAFSTVDPDGVTYEEELERIEDQLDDKIVPYGINIDPTLPGFSKPVMAPQQESTSKLNAADEQLISDIYEAARRELNLGDDSMIRSLISNSRQNGAPRVDA